MRATFLDPRLLDVANKILEWTRTFLMTENVNIPRKYSTTEVCPYVAPSIENNTFYMAFETDVSGRSEVEIEKIMLLYMDEFLMTHPFEESELIRKTLLVIFPDIPDRQTRVLDVVHKRIKTTFVKKGLMVGQFHKHCEDTSVHNPNFRVSISEIPFIAIRHMAPHDLIFLEGNDDAAWFDTYNARFGDRYKDSRSEDKTPFHEIYRKLKKKYYNK